MKDNIVYWVWLQQALKYKNQKIKYIINLYKDLERFYVSGEKEWRLAGVFNDKDIDDLKNFNLDEAKKIIEKCEKMGCEVIALDDEQFPYLLKQIADPPAVLYIRGNISCVSGNLTIAIVGTRKASNYGFEIAGNISKTLAENNVVVVSGGALGIDSAAHESAVSVGGKTICVLGCGIDYPYLSSKMALKKDIIRKGGAVITEYSPGTPARPWMFPARNRIISGLSHGTVVVEAGEKSGSLITANLANEQNRDVFVVAPRSDNNGSSGNLALMDDGAQIINSGEDVLREYSSGRTVGHSPVFLSTKFSKNIHEPNLKDSDYKTQNEESIHNKEEYSKMKSEIAALNEEERKVYEVISDGRVQVNTIVEKTEIPSYKVLGAITTLELLGLIKSLPGKYYEII